MNDLGKVMPHDPVAEGAVLGAIMIEEMAIFEVESIIKSEKAFYSVSNQLIYKAILELLRDNIPIDVVTVVNRVIANKTYDKIGGDEKGSYYISQLTIQVNSSKHITTHARIIVEMFMKRELIRAASIIERKAFNDDAFETLDEMQGLLADITNLAVGQKGFESYKEILASVTEELEEIRLGKKKSNLLPSGLKRYDRANGGFDKGKLYIIAARPGMGKTSLVMKIMNTVGVEKNKTVAFFSLEMSKEELMIRNLSAYSGVAYEKLSNKQTDITDADWESIMEAATTLSYGNVFTDDTPSLSLSSFIAKVKKLSIEQGDIGLIVIDYLQLMKVKIKGNREQEIGMITRTLKEVSKTINCPVIALAQLSRKVEDRGGDKIPMLSDLRESGSIEQDADRVDFVYRPEYYGITEDEDGNPTLGLAKIITAKNRGGATDTVKVKFIGERIEFTDLEEVEDYYQPPTSENPKSDFDYSFEANLENSEDFFANLP